MKAKKLSHKLSVIIPAYMQAKTILKDIKRIEQTLRQIRYPYEIIIVVDGCEDETSNKLSRLKSPVVKKIVYMKNQGKGYALRLGMSKATGDYIVFLDAGMEIDPNGISMLLEHLEWYDADVIVGSKRHPASIVEYPLERKILSICYQWIVWFLFHLKIRDTQAGIKIFRQKVLKKVLPRLLVKRYAFDLEMLAVAEHLGFTRIYEPPIKLKYNFGDIVHASTLRSIFYIFVDTLAIFYRMHILHYYDDNGMWRDKDKNSK